MKRYISDYLSQEHYYTVYRAEDGDELILVAVVMGVGWWDIAMKLTDTEAEMFRRSKDEFTQLVYSFIEGRESPKYKSRRIGVEHQGVNAIVIKNEGS
jgi:hypothetical protein